jgi:hypothetical protein
MGHLLRTMWQMSSPGVACYTPDAAFTRIRPLEDWEHQFPRVILSPARKRLFYCGNCCHVLLFEPAADVQICSVANEDGPH